MEGHKNIQYDICEKCKGMTKPKRPEKKPEIAYPLKGESLREFQGFNLCYDLHTPYIKYLEDKIEKLERRIK